MSASLDEKGRCCGKNPGMMRRVISLGAGVQSSTLLLMADRGLIPGGKPVSAIFADTLAEPAEVYRWLDVLKSLVGSIPIEVISAGSLATDTLRVRTTRKDGLRYWKNFIPAFTTGSRKGNGMYRRKCTSDYKVRPLNRAQRALIPRREYLDWRKAWRAGLNPPPLVETWIGISTDEVIRMKPSREEWRVNRYPLVELEMSRADCLAWMEAHAFPRPPRSACTFCPYRSDSEWLHLKRTAPEEFHAAVEFERAMQFFAELCKKTWGVPYLHASRKPLDTVQFKGDDTRGHYGNECEGMCGN